MFQEVTADDDSKKHNTDSDEELDESSDEELDEEFWSLPELDSSISQEIVLVFFNKAASIFKQIQKFRR